MEKNKYKLEHNKMQEMRKRYKTLYLNNKMEGKLEEPIPEHEYKYIEEVIVSIEIMVSKIKENKNYDDGKMLLKDINSLTTLRLNIEQAKRIKNILKEDNIIELKNLNILRNHIDVRKLEIFISNRLIEAIERSLSNAKSLEELKILKGEITKDLEKMNGMKTEILKSKISKKINEIQQKNAIRRSKSEISEEIREIIEQLAEGEIDIEKAKNIIDQQAKKKAMVTSNNRFGLTEEQQKKQLIIQIKNILAEQGDKYSIKNPEKTLQYLLELSHGELKTSLNVVIDNLIIDKKFGKARKMCDEFLPYKDERDVNYYPNMNMKNKIKNYEIGAIILDGINNAKTIQEEMDCIQYIQGIVSGGEVKPENIVLGKSEDKSVNIRLSDIWEDKRERNR